MKIYILNKNGHDVLTLGRKKLKAKVKELEEEGRYLMDKEGRRYPTVEDIPDTMEELLAVKELRHSGKRGY